MVSWMARPRLELLFHLCAVSDTIYWGTKKHTPANMMVFAMGYRANEDLVRCKDDEHRHQQILPRPR